MGTAGNRKGFKVFSINTTVRNPIRNVDFLEIFKNYNGAEKSKETLARYFFDLVKNGIYRPNKIPANLEKKIKLGEELSEDEVNFVIKNNPQETGTSGRVMTQLRALKDQGFLRIEKNNSKKEKISISKLGFELLGNNTSIEDVYTKSMIGMHSKNPSRKTIFNKSRPFLNTLFVINELNRRDEDFLKKGILSHEFGVFVLSMKDCDYKKAADNILKYRKKYGKKIEKDFFKEYLKSIDVLPLSEHSLLKDYPDDVFRKFEATGLLERHGRGDFVYIKFSNYNFKKIEYILDFYKDYKFINFETNDEYYKYLFSIKLPWFVNAKNRKEIIKDKAEKLGEKKLDFSDLNKLEEELDKKHSNKILNNIIDSIQMDIVLDELSCLSGNKKVKSRYSEVKESIRLEYFLAILFGKKYGKFGLESNLKLNEDGSPRQHAPGRKPDIIFNYEKESSLILEPTMLKNKSQQENSETTSIARHMREQKEKYGKQCRTIMIAPFVHLDIIDYFQYRADKEKVKLAPLTIKKTIELISKNKTIDNFIEDFDLLVDFLVNAKKIEDYSEKINI